MAETENLNLFYKKLEVAFNEKNYKEMLDVLLVITRFPLKRNDFVFQCIYLIIKKYYCIEIKEMLEKMIVFKKEQFKVNLLWKAVDNQERYALLNDHQKDVYYTAIFYGHWYYKMYDLYTTYDIYSWAYYITEQPIFLYYMGKMLFKNGKYEEAESYFKNYIKVGDSKVAKAYLYLSTLKKIKHKYDEAKRYSVYISEADKLYGDNFELEEIYTKADAENEEVDVVKIKIQNQDLREQRTTC